MSVGSSKIEWLEFDLLKGHPSVVHGVFLRNGGVSEGAYKSLNIANGVGDNPEHVKANRELVRQQLNVPIMFYPRLVHGSIIARLTTDNINANIEADGVFTKEPNIGLAFNHADCQTAIFYDPENETIGCVHAGWRGLVANIYAKMVRTLVEEVSTKPENLLVCISPALGPDHAEYKNFKTDFHQSFWSYQASKNYFDFWDIARMQLNDCGIPETNIEVKEVCTHCDKRRFFSYRRDKVTGRNVTVAALRP